MSEFQLLYWYFQGKPKTTAAFSPETVSTFDLREFQIRIGNTYFCHKNSLFTFLALHFWTFSEHIMLETVKLVIPNFKSLLILAAKV